MDMLFLIRSAWLVSSNPNVMTFDSELVVGAPRFGFCSVYYQGQEVCHKRGIVRVLHFVCLPEIFSLCYHFRERCIVFNTHYLVEIFISGSGPESSI